MNPIRKELAADDQFAFALTYKNRKQPENELPDHFHDWYELVYVYDGQGRFFIHRTFYEMHAGDLFLLPANAIHRAFPDGRDPVTSTALFFGPALIQPYDWDARFPLLGCFDQAKAHGGYKLALVKEEQYEMESLLRDIHREQTVQAPGYRHAILIGLQQLLLLLNRLASGSGRGAKEDAPLIPIWMREILPYIDQHLDRELHLSALSRKACVTASHFARVFKQWTGMTVTEYILSRRIVQAKEWLLTTDGSIEHIAGCCGFESTSYFYKTFRRLTNMTPTAYKKAHRP